MDISTVKEILGVTRSRIYQIDELRPFAGRGEIDPLLLIQYIRGQIEEYQSKINDLQGSIEKIAGEGLLYELSDFAEEDGSHEL